MIVPVYNEIRTVGQALTEIVAKTIPGWEFEVIIVESNSTDGTREIVDRFARPPHVQVIHEERPRGKGHAVRAGLGRATGDVILIQDADLEYSLSDYERLLAPIRAGEQTFVLGSRHTPGAGPMRKFVDQPVQAFVLNAAHEFFAACINLALRTRLRDPFTMYKVFRRDCLVGLHLESNRFDFDWELLIKLVRRGHRPLEVPVTYVSRSFKEGKKISIVRDPVTWLWALVKYRFGPL